MFSSLYHFFVPIQPKQIENPRPKFSDAKNSQSISKPQNPKTHNICKEKMLPPCYNPLLIFPFLKTAAGGILSAIHNRQNENNKNSDSHLLSKKQTKKLPRHDVFVVKRQPPQKRKIYMIM
jgi:hypothetical protein